MTTIGEWKMQVVWMVSMQLEKWKYQFEKQILKLVLGEVS